MEKDLIKTLQTLGDPITSFVVCTNADTHAFKLLLEGNNSDEVVNEMTFFHACVQNILSNKEAISLLKNIKVLSIKKEKDDPFDPDISVYYVLVSCPDDKYQIIKPKLKEMLS